jgi:hypothetical protein
MTTIYGNNATDTPPRPHIIAALLAQAASVEPGACLGYDEQAHRIGAAMPSETGQAIVTWKGKDASGKDRPE